MSRIPNSTRQVGSLAELNQFLAEIKHFAAPRKLEALESIAGPNASIHYEVIGTKSARGKKGAGKFGHLQNSVVGRVIIAGGKQKHKCLLSGTVVDLQTMEILVPPSAKLVAYTGSHKALDKEYANYDVYEIEDGTTLTLYKYGDHWAMASANGYDVSNYKWIGANTYSSIVNHILENCATFSVNLLDENFSYQIGIRCHEMHVIRRDPERAWLLRVTDRTGAVVDAPNPGIPLQAPLTAEKRPNNYSALVQINKDALAEARKKNGPVKYGYILRDSTGSGYLLESTLMHWIRTNMYEMPNLPKDSTMVITPETRLVYGSLRAYLNNKSKCIALDLMPEFGPAFASYDKLFDTLVHDIDLRLQIERPVIGIPDDHQSQTEICGPHRTLVAPLANYVKRQVSTPLGRHSANIIRDLIVSSQSLELLFMFITRQ